MYTIHTNYNPDLHKTPRFSAYEDDNSKMLAPTEEERLKVERAVVAASLVDLKYQVFEYSVIRLLVSHCSFFQLQEQLQNGEREVDSSYISITSDLLNE